MTNAHDFTLDAELDATAGWDDDDEDLDDPDDADDDWESGYADEPDPEDDDRPSARWTSPSATRCAASPACRTELEDITEVEYRQLRLERVVLVGVWTEGTVEDAENSMAELALLAETAGSEVLDAIYQRRRQARPGDVHRPRQGRRARARSCRPPAPTP